MSDELNNADGAEQPEAKTESQQSIQPSSGAVEPGNSTELSSTPLQRENATDPGLSDLHRTNGQSESKQLNPIPQNTAESASGQEQLNLTREEGTDREPDSAVRSAEEAKQLAQGPIEDKAEDQRNEAAPSGQTELAEPDWFGPLTDSDVAALRSHDEYLGRGNYSNRPEDDDDYEVEFHPSPAVDLMRHKEQIYISFVQWRGAKPTLTLHSSAIRYGNRTYGIPVLPRALYESMLLPTALGDFRTTGSLFKTVHTFLQKHLILSEKQSALLTYWCIASWFPDVLDFVPRVTITGPRYAAELLFRLLRCVCRRPVLLSGISPAVLKAIPIADLMPTLLIRENRLSRRTAELLDASDQKGYLVGSGGQLHYCYCARCVYLGEEQSLGRSVPGGLHFHVASNGSLPDQLIPIDADLQILQNLLFSYRSFNRDRVESSNYHPSGLLPELCAVARQLGAAIVEDVGLQQRIPELLKEQDEQARVDRSIGLKGAVLRAVLRHCHQSEQQVFTHQIAITVKEIYREEGESLKVSSESVGHALKSLGLYSRRLGSAGRGLVLDKTLQSRAHALARAYEVLPEPPECGFCLDVQPKQSEELMQVVSVVQDIIDPPSNVPKG